MQVYFYDGKCHTTVLEVFSQKLERHSRTFFFFLGIDVTVTSPSPSEFRVDMVCILKLSFLRKIALCICVLRVLKDVYHTLCMQ